DEETEGAVGVPDGDVVADLDAAALQPEAVAAVADVERVTGVALVAGDGQAVVVAVGTVGADGQGAGEPAELAAVLGADVRAAHAVGDVAVHQAVAPVVDDPQLRAADDGAIPHAERLLLVGRAPADVEVDGVTADGVGVGARDQLAVLHLRAGQR